MKYEITSPLMPLNNGDLAFDIGANVGNFAMGMLVLGCRVIALEPQPRTHTELYYRCKRLRQMTCLCAACGDKSGTASICILEFDGDSQGSYIPSPYQCNSGAHSIVACKVVTLDDLIAKYGKPRGIKIDVEGYEPLVLAGLSQPIEFVSFELIKRTPWKTPACLKEFARLGDYEFNFRRQSEDFFRLRHWLPPAEFLEWWNSALDEGDAHARLKK